MNICGAPLAYSFAKSPFQLWFSYLCGLLGIWGWGLGFEFLFRNRVRGWSFWHAFLEGTVITSFLMLLLSVLGSVLGFWQTAWPVTLLGITVGLVSLFFQWRGKWQKKKHPRRSILEAATVLIITLPTAFFILMSPFWLGDTSSIWGFHAKVLTCFPLFGSSFVQEKVWAGTHPEYPLFLSFLHSLFFALADSFRDDWIKVWQSVSLICGVLAGFFSLKRVFKSSLPAFSGVFIYLVAGGHGIVKSSVELNSSLFVWLFALSLVSNDRWRMSLYLLGFLFCKNEGVAGSILFVGLLLAYSFFQKKPLTQTGSFTQARSLTSNPLVDSKSFTHPKSSSDPKELTHSKGLAYLKNITYLGPWAVGAAFWIWIMTLLPSNHEQYPSHLLSLDAWKNGIPRIPYILEKCFQVLRPNRDWRFMMLLLPLMGIGLLSRPIRKSTDYEGALLPVSWATLMLGVFLCIYIVSPWGPDLYSITFFRLFIQIFPAMGVSGIAILAILGNDKNQGIRKFGILAQVVLMVYYGVTVKNNFLGTIENYLLLAKDKQIGTEGYLHDPEWNQAFAWDKVLPPASRGAFIHPKGYYFTPNYMLFPRTLYPSPPNQVAGTLAPWPAWKTMGEVPKKELGLRFIIETESKKVVLTDGQT